MNNTSKILVLVVGLAIALPLVYSEKLLHWLPPYGVNPNNLFQIAGAQMAQLSLSLRHYADPIPPDNVNRQVESNNASVEVTPSTQKKFTAPQKPYRILLVGDSSMAVSGGVGDIIEQKLGQFDQTTLLRKGKVSSGLSRPDYFDWIGTAKNTVDEFSPNIVIVMMGTNDAQSFNIDENGKKVAVTYGTAKWDEEYSKRISKFIAAFTDSNSILYWIGLPAMREPAYDKKIQHLSTLHKEAVLKNPLAKFVSGFELMAGDQNAYQSFMPDSNDVNRATRNSDGIHLSYFGGTILVEKIINKLKEDLDLSIATPKVPISSAK